MTDLIFKVKRFSYGPETRKRVEELRAKYSDVMNLEGPRLHEVTRRALIAEIECGTVKPINNMLYTLEVYLAKCSL